MFPVAAEISLAGPMTLPPKETVAVREERGSELATSMVTKLPMRAFAALNDTSVSTGGVLSTWSTNGAEVTATRAESPGVIFAVRGIGPSVSCVVSTSKV